MILKLRIILIINFMIFVKGDDINVSCKNDKGENVDWFYLYKLPAHYKKSSNADTDGLDYMYLTNNDFQQWVLSSHKINESTSMPGLTLDHLLNNASIMLITYNDEFPVGHVVSTGGHTKGVIATDGVTGIWLVHSVPKFPAISKYDYPSTATRYGQSFLCITFNATEMEKIGEQLLFNEPSIYYKNVPEDLSGKFPHLEKAINKEWIRLEPFNNVLDLISLGGSIFKSFAKTSKYNKELFEDFVAPTLDTNLLVQTWHNGNGNIKSNCTLSDKVYNIESVELDELNIEFPTTRDHSKWAVSQSLGLKLWRWRPNSTFNWICVGDINRQEHQLVRGGGVLCQQHKKVSKLYRQLVKQYEHCS